MFHEREAASASAPGLTKEELAAMPDDVGELKRELYEARFERDLAGEVLAVLKKPPRRPEVPVEQGKGRGDRRVMGWGRIL